MSTSIEKEIVKLLLIGDQRAMSLLYKNYADSLYGVILKIISDEDLAQDVLQETFIKVWRKAKTYDPKKAKLFTWLYRVAYNTAIDKVRSKTKKDRKKSKLRIQTYIS